MAKKRLSKRKSRKRCHYGRRAHSKKCRSKPGRKRKHPCRHGVRKSRACKKKSGRKRKSRKGSKKKSRKASKKSRKASKKKSRKASKKKSRKDSKKSRKGSTKRKASKKSRKGSTKRKDSGDYVSSQALIVVSKKKSPKARIAGSQALVLTKKDKQALVLTKKDKQALVVVKKNGARKPREHPVIKKRKSGARKPRKQSWGEWATEWSNWARKKVDL